MTATQIVSKFMDTYRVDIVSEHDGMKPVFIDERGHRDLLTNAVIIAFIWRTCQHAPSQAAVSNAYRTLRALASEQM